MGNHRRRKQRRVPKDEGRSRYDLSHGDDSLRSCISRIYGNGDSGSVAVTVALHPGIIASPSGQLGYEAVVVQRRSLWLQVCKQLREGDVGLEALSQSLAELVNVVGEDK